MSDIYNLFKYFHHFLEQSKVDSMFDLSIVGNIGNVQSTCLKIMVENLPINFEDDPGFAHSAISEKLYLRRCKAKYSNDLTLKYYVGVCKCTSKFF